MVTPLKTLVLARTVGRRKRLPTVSFRWSRRFRLLTGFKWAASPWSLPCGRGSAFPNFDREGA